ncbi:MAG: hybrid sensor histidine kinase/response regulator [Candidatus Kariarchaeaceae archaeon]
MKPEIIDPNKLIRKYLSSFGKFITKSVSVSSSYDNTVGKINIDPVRLEQVVINLMINAVDAMPDGGTLSIKTKRIPIFQVKHKGKVNHLPLVEISFTDTGVGMSKEVVGKIFEPFFTTKDPDKGTGLGLTTAYSIIEQSDGFIEVDSELGQGSTLSIYLPIADSKEVVNQFDKRKLTGFAIPVDEKILLIDDDDNIRSITKNILNMSNIDVLDAGQAFDALRIFNENKDQITLVICDIVMPDLDGPQLVEKLIAVKPSIKILYITGYTENFQLISDSLTANMGILQKPFDRDTLINSLKELVNR